MSRTRSKKNEVIKKPSWSPRQRGLGSSDQKRKERKKPPQSKGKDEDLCAFDRGKFASKKKKANRKMQVGEEAT